MACCPALRESKHGRRETDVFALGCRSITTRWKFQLTHIPHYSVGLGLSVLLPYVAVTLLHSCGAYTKVNFVLCSIADNELLFLFRI